MDALREFIIEKSKKLNIDIIGFTSGDPLLDLEDYLSQRSSMGYETEFEEKDISKRLNPKLSLESCKSIIVIGLSYNNDFETNKDIAPRGILSKTSWGEDYHRVLKSRMESLIGEIKKVKDFSYKAFVDTGPLIDRELARKAGIGYYGKNCSIINKDYGSFIFLGYILSDLEVEIENKLVEDGCGDCDLCIRVCPTGALEEPYRLNPKKCISYLTQTKDIILDDLRDKMGNRLYGCDTCQLVCPKNKGVILANHIEFIPSLTKVIVDIEELLFMSNRKFKEKYGSMSGAWRGKNILIRNAIIALGNTRDKKHIPLLESYNEKDNRWEDYVNWAINKILTRA